MEVVNSRQASEADPTYHVFVFCLTREHLPHGGCFQQWIAPFWLYAFLRAFSFFQQSVHPSVCFFLFLGMFTEAYGWLSPDPEVAFHFGPICSSLLLPPLHRLECFQVAIGFLFICRYGRAVTNLVGCQNRPCCSRPTQATLFVCNKRQQLDTSSLQIWLARRPQGLDPLVHLHSSLAFTRVTEHIHCGPVFPNLGTGL